MLNDKTVEVAGKTYKVQCACTEDEREVGLQDVTELGEDEGMLFVFDEPTEVGFWMKDTLIPLDIIFIDEYGDVVSVHTGEPMNEDEIFQDEDIMYVLEVNIGSGIKVGDEVDLSDIEGETDIDDDDEEESEATTMHVIDENGDSQMELKGGERIFSRPNTKTLVKLAKRAWKSKSDKDYKALGRKVFKYIDVQNNKEDDYVQTPGK